MKDWFCEDPECRHEVVAENRPSDIRWTDGHVCRFIEAYDETFDHDPGEMDGDAASALASAGWGTDEDYGGGCEPIDDDRFETADFYTGGDE